MKMMYNKEMVDALREKKFMNFCDVLYYYNGLYGNWDAFVELSDHDGTQQLDKVALLDDVLKFVLNKLKQSDECVHLILYADGSGCFNYKPSPIHFDLLTSGIIEALELN